MEQPAQTNRPANCETAGGDDAITTKPAFGHGTSLVAALGEKMKNTVIGFEYAEHCYLGDTIILTLADGRRVVGKDHPFTLDNQLIVTYGQINALGGDFYGTTEPISDGGDDAEQARRFVNAYNTLAAPSPRQPAEATEILGVLKKEVDAVNHAIAQHQDPSVAYSGLDDASLQFQAITLFRPSDMPSYFGLCWINWDHFGEDARTAYNAGHSKALDVAIAGDLQRAYTMNAFADHFLEDSFAAGHLRTPRRYLHSSTWLNSEPDFCAGLMHDEDNAIGLSVKNPAGETWTAYGDKRGLNPENDENKRRCLQALQTSVDEIYTAWKSGKKPDKASHGAWAHAPTLESARGPQALAPLVHGEQRRRKLQHRRSWSFRSDWTFAGTVFECAACGWWKYPIKIDGPSGSTAETTGKAK
ncbi:hypothetical protein F5Y14DRAFT_164539 [Nemania sp. NC0429]|nr:hypothetical protein F5Y14DRAFT_164539 [Nemania sp. NC0429]